MPELTKLRSWLPRGKPQQEDFGQELVTSLAFGGRRAPPAVDGHIQMMLFFFETACVYDSLQVTIVIEAVKSVVGASVLFNYALNHEYSISRLQDSVCGPILDN